MKNPKPGTQPTYYISLDKTFDSIIEAEAYMKSRQIAMHHIITYYKPQPKIPIWVIRILKFFNLYK